MKERAYAKINMALDVFNIREDGYHDIRSIMVPISFYDDLEINIAEQDDYFCNRYHIRFNEHNSIIKLITALKEKYGINDHYMINLKKYIPVKAGLGGGTSDAAAALRIFQRMYGFKMSREEIIEICLKVGADVPFNYFNVPAVVSGIGDEIEPIEMKKDYHVVLVKPKTGVSTKEAYDILDMDKCDHPDIDKLKLALKNGSSLDGLLGNSLEESALILNDEVSTIKKMLLELGGEHVLMSGSGSTVFALSEDAAKTYELYEKLKNSQYFVRFARTMK